MAKYWSQMTEIWERTEFANFCYYTGTLDVKISIMNVHKAHDKYLSQFSFFK